MIENIILFIIALIVHEIGHYVGYLLFKKKPDIKFKWYGVINIGTNVWPNLKPLQAYIVSVLGVLAGGFVVYGNYELFLIYLLACCIDLTNIISIYGIKKEDRKLTLLEIAEKDVMRLKENVV